MPTTLNAPQTAPSPREIVQGVVSRFALYPSSEPFRFGGRNGGSFSVILEGSSQMRHGVLHNSLADVHFMKPGDRVRFECEGTRIVEGTFLNESFRSVPLQD